MSDEPCPIDPFKVLDVPIDADDERVKAAYFEGLRRFPPDRDPEGFMRLRQAYEMIRSENDRIAIVLGWNLPLPDVRVVLRELERRSGPKPAAARLWLDLIARAQDRRGS